MDVGDVRAHSAKTTQEVDGIPMNSHPTKSHPATSSAVSPEKFHYIIIDSVNPVESFEQCGAAWSAFSHEFGISEKRSRGLTIGSQSTSRLQLLPRMYWPLGTGRNVGCMYS